MRKKLLSILLTLCMVLTTLPVSAMADTPDVALNVSTNTYYTTLQAAINAVKNNETIMLRNSITLTVPVAIDMNSINSFTLDLNGKTLDGGSNPAIDHKGSGMLTITSSIAGGKVTSKKSESIPPSGTINNNGGKVTVSGGEVSNTESNGIAIYNTFGGIVNITGGTVRATGDSGKAIYNNNLGGNVNIKGGIVSASGSTGNAIYHNSTSSVSITGGTVSATGSCGTAINNNSTGQISIPSGTVTIKGSEKAMNKAPVLTLYTNVKITADKSNPEGSTTSTSVIAKTDLTNDITSYKYIKIEPTPVQINNTKYVTLQDAVNAVQNNETIKLLDSITLTEAAAIDANSSKSFTLDLNGKTLDGGSNPAIDHNGSGTLTITSSIAGGKVTSNTEAMFTPIGTINNNRSGKVTVSSGEVSTTGNYGIAIFNKSDGIINITGGTVSATSDRSTAINNYSTGTVSITGGTISSTGAPGYTINNRSGGNVNITGGTVSSTGAGYTINNGSGGNVNITGGTVSADAGYTISNSGSGKIKISGTAKITGKSNYTIYLSGGNNADTVLEITGGTVENTGTYTVIVNGSGSKIVISGTAKVTGKSMSTGTIWLFGGNNTGTVLEITGGTVENTGTGTAISNNATGQISIPSGTVIIKGGGSAMNKVPDLSNYTNVMITDATASEIEKTTLTDATITSYKYLKFEPAPARVAEINSTKYTTLQAAVDAVQNNQTIKLLDSIILTASVTIASSNSNSFTLDLNGKTLDGGSNRAIKQNGSGTLTITDSTTGGKITSSTTIDGTISNNSTGNVTVSGGEVTNSGSYGIAIYNLSTGSVSIAGGTVSAAGIRGNAIYNNSTGSVSITGGSLSSTGTYGIAIYNYAMGSVSITGGTLGATGIAIYNSNDGIISIPSGTVIIKGGEKAMNKVPYFGSYANVKITANTSNPDDSNISEIEKTTLTTSTIGNYKYIKFEPAPDVAEINSTKYSTLQEAVNAVQNNQTIKLLDSITLTASVAIALSNSNSFTLDLKGKTLNGGSNPAIKHNGSGMLTITDSSTGGKITSSTTTDGTISNNSTGYVTVSGGEVSNTASSGSAIYNKSTGNVSITGGTVSATGASGKAIYNKTTGKITISGTAKVTSANTNQFSGTIYLETQSYANSVLDITGGTVENKGVNGTAIFNYNFCIIKISGGVVSATEGASGRAIVFSLGTSGGYIIISGNTVVVKSSGPVMNTAPDLSSYTNVKVTASPNYDGSSPVDTYDPTKIANYKYLSFAENPDTALVNTAKSVVESGSYTVTQAAGNTVDDVKKALAAQINNLSGMSATGVTVAASNITFSSFTAASAGTSGKPEGTNGSFTFTVNLTKGVVSKTTSSKTGIINATAYTGVSDTNAVAAAMTATIDGTVNVTYGADQATKTAAVQTYVNSLLTGNAAGVTAIVTHSSGNTYQVALTKGTVNNSKSITMTINENANPDIALVNSAKSIIEGGSYTMTQAAANTVDAVKAALASQINALSGMSATGVTVAASDITIDPFTAASEGTSGKPEGTNGSFDFTVNLTKGAVNKTTASKTGTINATAYTGISDTDAVAAAITATIDGTVNVTYGADEATKTAAVQTYVNSLLTGNAAGVTATVTHSSDNTYQVALNKGKVNNSKSITMTINENANPDIALVNNAILVIKSGNYTMAQSTAATDAAIKADLAIQIKNLPGMSSTSIEVTGSAITLTSFTPASAGTSGNPKGKNGGFTFKVTLTKGTVSQTTDELTGIITATVYGGVTDTEVVAAAKTIIESGSYTMTQGNNTELEVKAVLENKIKNLPGMSSTSIEVTGSAITLTSFTPASAGTSGNPKGKNGSFTFKVILTKGTVSQTTVEMTGIITATEYVPSSGGNTDFVSITTPAKKEGKIEKDQKQEGNAPTANLKDSTEDLKAKVLTAEELKQVADGKDAKVILKVQDISTSVSAEDKKQIEEKLAAEQQNTGNMALLYIDISLFKKIGDGEETRITETSGKIRISIEVPESMWSSETGTDRTYRVIRVHNGVTEVLEGTYDPATHLFTFETDRFSTYALTYQDLNKVTEEKKDKTEDNADKKADKLDRADKADKADKADSFVVYQDFNHLRLTAKAAKTSQKLSYAKVAGADGYFIYGAKYGQKLKKLADVKGTVRNYTVKKLKKGTYYKYQVKAYKILDGKKVIIAISSPIYSVTTDKTYGNPTKLTIKTSSITLTTGITKEVTYQVVLPKNKKMKDFASSIGFETTNKKIATISSSGKITAKAVGTCYVYAYAQNGVYKKIKVTVK